MTDAPDVSSDYDEDWMVDAVKRAADVYAALEEDYWALLQEWNRVTAERDRLRASIVEWANRLRRSCDSPTRNVVVESVHDVEWDMREIADPRWQDPAALEGGDDD